MCLIGNDLFRHIGHYLYRLRRRLYLFAPDLLPAGLLDRSQICPVTQYAVYLGFIVGERIAGVNKHRYAAAFPHLPSSDEQIGLILLRDAVELVKALAVEHYLE